MIKTIIFNILFLGIPLALIVLFVVSLCRYKSAVKQNKKVPGAFSDEEIKKRRTILTVFSVIAGIIAVIVIGLIALMFMAVAFM
ncbi:MAG: hypothetical protein E7505_03900 [Ruminococcus sp.]|nr:hypothetical protein [Ruminococcus sp.]